MLDDGLPDGFGQPYRHSVPNLPSGRLDAAEEYEVVREGLERCCLTDADRAILLWMSVAAVGNARAFRGQYGRRSVPVHPTVDIAVTVMTTMTF